jgi:hypothetical protein
VQEQNELLKGPLAIAFLTALAHEMNEIKKEEERILEHYIIPDVMLEPDTLVQKRWGMHSWVEHAIQRQSALIQTTTCPQFHRSHLFLRHQGQIEWDCDADLRDIISSMPMIEPISPSNQYECRITGAPRFD